MVRVCGQVWLYVQSLCTGNIDFYSCFQSHAAMPKKRNQKKPQPQQLWLDLFLTQVSIIKPVY